MPEGTMEKNFVGPNVAPLDGIPDTGTIILTFSFPDGIQGPEHPNPNKGYTGTSRKAYLPDNPDGRKILGLIELAWERRLLFRVGTSVTTGSADQVIWNGIHLKTARNGGASNYGYPDPTYFTRVTEELSDKGITLDQIQ